MINQREERGKLIAQTRAITKVNNGYLVSSQSSKKKYLVSEHLDSCNCPDCQTRKVRCKHAFAVEYFLQKATTTNGETKVETKRLTYPQAWSAYNKSQETEKTRFIELLKDLSATIKEPSYEFGRPKITQKDLFFSSALKVYTQFSLRRFMSDLNECKNKNQIEKKPCFASIGHYLQNKELTPLLKEMITTTAETLKSVEKNFAVDSSGFRTNSFNSYCQEKHGTTKKNIWLKAHLLSGVKTNIVCSAEITKSYGKGTGDISSFKPLVQNLKNFEVKEITADGAYNSRESYNVVAEQGGQAYIPYPKDTTATSHTGSKGRRWRQMFHYFQYNKEDFMKHYHLRSNSETVFHMIKSKFGEALKSKTFTAQINELLFKILCHNIVVMIHETNELGIKANFQN
jgi:hypothetical protein